MRHRFSGGERLTIGDHQTPENQLDTRRPSREIGQEGERLEPRVADESGHIGRHEDMIRYEDVVVPQLLGLHHHLSESLGIEDTVAVHRDVLTDADTKRHHFEPPLGRPGARVFERPGGSANLHRGAPGRPDRPTEGNGSFGAVESRAHSS